MGSIVLYWFFYWCFTCFGYVFRSEKTKMKKFKPKKHFWDLYFLFLIVTVASLFVDSYVFDIMKVTMGVAIIIFLYLPEIK